MNLWRPIIKRMDIIVWIRVCPNWKMNFNFKNGTMRCFSYKTKASIHLSQRAKWICCAQSLIERRLLCEWHKEKFLLWNQSIDSFILTSRINLWCPMIKGMKIIMWIRVYPTRKTNFDFKNGTNKSFSYEIKALIHLSQWVKWICGAQSLEEWRLLCDSVFIPFEKRTLILKMAQREIFLMKPKDRFIYPNK